MIIIKDKSNENTVHIVKTYSDGYSGNYSIVLQNTLTKQITIFQTLEDIGNPLYHMFNINVSSLEDGEYYLQLLNNPENLDFVVSPNAPKLIELVGMKIIYIVNKGDFITNDGFFLINGFEGGEGGSQTSLTPVASELLRIGEYISPTSQYNSEKKYLQYNG